MKHLKRLGLSFTLMSVLAMSAAETTESACEPGHTSTPPCASQSVSDDSTAPGQTETPPASSSVDFVDIVEAALWSLSLF